MIITGMKHFESVCQKKLVEWYNRNTLVVGNEIDLGDVFVVWSCKTLQNYPMCRKTPCFSYGDIRHFHRIYVSN